LIVRRGVEDKLAYRRGISNSATARGLMQALRRLAEHEVVSPQDSDDMIAMLGGQQFNEMIPARLPEGARVAHKTGWVADYFHDAGIVYPPTGKPFVLCILTKGYEEADEAAASEFIAELSQLIYQHWAAA
jgi:beta-lactamase class A